MNQPIGIFDSGIGGLTVAKAIQKHLPNESIIYFGDTAHLPYGDKSSKAIKGYSEKITEFLLSKGCKTIVIACNTASAHAYKEVKQLCVDNNAIAFNVIDPVVNYTASNFQNQKVGVIGTKGTIKSRIYVRKITSKNQNIEVVSRATPLLAPMIEEGFFNNYISKTIIHNYLETKSLKNISAIILACTHYPLIKEDVDSYFKKKVKIIDSADIVAQSIKAKLIEKNLLSKSKSAHYEFFVSDYTKSFEKSTKFFFGEQIKLRQLNLWK